MNKIVREIKRKANENRTTKRDTGLLYWGGAGLSRQVTCWPAVLTCWPAVR